MSDLFPIPEEEDKKKFLSFLDERALQNYLKRTSKTYPSLLDPELQEDTIGEIVHEISSAFSDWLPDAFYNQESNTSLSDVTHIIESIVRTFKMGKV